MHSLHCHRADTSLQQAERLRLHSFSSPLMQRCHSYMLQCARYNHMRGHASWSPAAARSTSAGDTKQTGLLHSCHSLTSAWLVESVHSPPHSSPQLLVPDAHLQPSCCMRTQNHLMLCLLPSIHCAPLVYSLIHSPFTLMQPRRPFGALLHSSVQLFSTCMAIVSAWCPSAHPDSRRTSTYNTKHTLSIADAHSTPQLILEHNNSLLHHCQLRRDAYADDVLQ